VLRRGAGKEGSTAGGYEYNLVLLAAVFGLTENRPGPMSIDGAIGRPRWGTGWALAALAAAVPALPPCSRRSDR
jgi:putative oxidoreductase